MSESRKALLIAAEAARAHAAALEALADEELHKEPAPSPPPPPDDGQLLTINEAAARLGMSRSWVYQQINSGDLPIVQLGGSVRIRLGEINAFISSRSL